MTELCYLAEVGGEVDVLIYLILPLFQIQVFNFLV